MNFTFSHPVLGCLGLFGVHFIAISGNPLLATSFVYPLLVGAEKLLYMFFCSILVLKTVLWTFWQSVHGWIVLFGPILVPHCGFHAHSLQLFLCSLVLEVQRKTALYAILHLQKICSILVQKTFVLGSNPLLATSFMVSMLIVSEKNSCVSVFVFVGARRCSEKLLYMLFRNCSKFAAFWYKKHCFR